MQRHSDIAVIIVNYGTAALALRAVESVMTHAPGCEIHLVDNASPNGDAAVLADALAMRGWQTDVVFYPEDRNHGFGCGNNVVLEALARRKQPPARVMLLNPDARLENDAPGLLSDCLDTHPEAGAVGARLSDAEGRPSTSAFRFPSIVGEFAEYASFGPVTRLLDPWRIPLPPDLPTGPVDWVTGAAVMFRFDALRQVGFFDPGFFLYYEEVELMRRLSRAGWTCFHVAEARVSHVEGAATELRGDEVGLRPRPAYWYESRRLYSYRALGRVGAIANACAAMAGAGFNHATSRLRGRKPWLPGGFVTDSWRIVLRPLLRGWRPD